MRSQKTRLSPGREVTAAESRQGSAQRQKRKTRRSAGVAGVVEGLESRVLLSATPAAVKATAHPAANLSTASSFSSLNAAARAALQAAANTKSGSFHKLGGGLGRAFAEYTQYLAAGTNAAGGAGGSKGRFHSGNGLLHLSGANSDRVAVEAFAAQSGGGAALAAALKGLGAGNVQQFGDTVSAAVPLAVLNKLAALPSLGFVRPVWYRTNGAATSQGDASMRADLARAATGASGAGVKVGILSDSFDTDATASTHYADDVATGDLPADVQVLQDEPAGTDEGRAMAQLVHDTAPDAKLAFDTAYGGEAAFAQHIKDLKNAGANVIVDDVSYFAEPMFQDGVVSQAVDSVVAGGASYFSAAGNEARQSYESPFRPGLNRAQDSIPSDILAPEFGGGLTHDFDPGPGVDDMQKFTLAPGQSITLVMEWDQPFKSIPGSKACKSDVDIYVLNADGTEVLEGSTDDNILGGDPVEAFNFTNDTGATADFNLMIAKYGTSGPNPTTIKYVNFDQDFSAEYATNSGTLLGHANAAGAAAVAAAPWFFTPAFGVTPPLVESYSSAGGTPILFDKAGNRLSQSVTRRGPLVTAPDGGNTTFFYADTGFDADAQPNFFGTSAAAPAAAAVAALMLSSNPTLTPTQVYSALSSTALDMDDPFTAGFDTGPDFTTGAGLVRADAALAAVQFGGISGQVFQDNNGNGVADPGEGQGGVTVYVDTNNNGQPDPGETTTTTSATGIYSFAGLPSAAVGAGPYHVREVVPSGYARLSAASSDVAVATGQTAAGPAVANFPTTFTGTANSDGFLLRLDAATGGNVQIVLNPGGPTPQTFTAAKSLVPSLAFSGGAGDDTLTIDYANGNPIPAGGVSFDAGTDATGTGVTPAGDTLVLSGSAAADTFVVNGNSATLTPPAGGGNGGTGPTPGAVTFSNLEHLTVNGNAGDDTLTIDVAPSAAVAFNGGTPDSGGTSGGVTSSSGSASDQDTLNVNAGPFAFGADAAAGTTNLTIHAAGAGTNVVFNASQHLAGLTLSGGATATLSGAGASRTVTNHRILVTGSLSIDAAAGSRLDLADNDLVLKGGGVAGLASVQSLISSGYAKHAWTGSGIVTSTAAGKTSNALAYALNDGSVIKAKATFGPNNEPVGPSDVLVKYTYEGDSNLDGQVSFDDYFYIDSKYPKASGSTWVTGDFDYNGQTSFDDYFYIDSNYPRSTLL